MQFWNQRSRVTHPHKKKNKQTGKDSKKSQNKHIKQNTKHKTRKGTGRGSKGKTEENRETHVSIVTALFGTVLTRFTDSPR